MRIIGATEVDNTSPRSGKRNTERYEIPEIMIGKDVLELVSSAMYIDPMTVYREYIQNAADAVDAARSVGTLSITEPGRVDISVDTSTRTVRIRDNGCGVPFREFGHTLTALGGSVKRSSSTRGFRGVGRLAGLAYAKELVFRSRVLGEANISELRWDCLKLKAVLRDASDDIGVADLIRKVTTLEKVDSDDAPEHFFEVEMRGVIRLRNDSLISPLAISEYLSQVAPVPFSPEFSFGLELSEKLSRHVTLGELEVRINDVYEPIYRPHRDSISFDRKPSLNFGDLSFIEIPSTDDGLAAIAWILHHEYEGALPTGTLVKGLRLRTGNIQVGGHSLLEDVFSEPRFNSWAVGEVHVIDRRIVPNGRRDQFEQNVHFQNLINHLTPTVRNIARRCRTSSIRRKQEREFELCAQMAEETISIINQGSASRLKQDQLALSVEQTLLRMSKISSHHLLSHVADELENRIVALRKQLSKAMNDDSEISSPLMRLPKEQRKFYEHFFELIYECSLNRTAAKALIDRILLKVE